MPSFLFPSRHSLAAHSGHLGSLFIALAFRPLANLANPLSLFFDSSETISARVASSSSDSRETSSVVTGTLSGLGRPTGEELIAKQVFRSASQVQLVWLTGIMARIYNPLFAPISRFNNKNFNK